MAQHFNEQVIEALDKCAPIKEMKIRQTYKEDLTDRKIFGAVNIHYKSCVILRIFEIK